MLNRILNASRHGDPVARELLTNHLRPQITRMAIYFAAKTREDPDDLLQEAWLGLLRALPNVNMKIGDPTQYLLCQARWRMQDYARRSRLRRCDPLEETDRAEPLTPGPDARLGDIDILSFVDRLPEHRQQIARNIMEGKTWREAGEAVGCSGANVAYHIKQMRRDYEKWQR